MTAIGPVKALTFGLGGQPRIAEPPARKTAPSTALVAVTPPARQDDATNSQPRRPLASFLAQLIANERGFPQTRERRRAEPHEAAAAYSAAALMTRRRR